MKLETSSRTLLVLSSSDGAAATRAATPTRSTTRRVIVTHARSGVRARFLPERRGPPAGGPLWRTSCRASALELERPGAEAVRRREQAAAIREDRQVRHGPRRQARARRPPLVVAAERPVVVDPQLHHAEVARRVE